LNQKKYKNSYHSTNLITFYEKTSIFYKTLKNKHLTSKISIVKNQKRILYYCKGLKMA